MDLREKIQEQARKDAQRLHPNLNIRADQLKRPGIAMISDAVQLIQAEAVEAALISERTKNLEREEAAHDEAVELKLLIAEVEEQGTLSDRWTDKAMACVNKLIILLSTPSSNSTNTKDQNPEPQ